MSAHISIPSLAPAPVVNALSAAWPAPIRRPKRFRYGRADRGRCA